jgi:hypothetical protein
MFLFRAFNVNVLQVAGVLEWRSLTFTPLEVGEGMVIRHNV